ncbi:IS21 family transposase, ORF1 [Endozoicomonas montiporae CL-33]|uniref:IS21 family transposase, ORF1 n=1 Tax=Endozoicomonas montiporae CL-33 TaxID=570277 RepID=A0A142BGN4_9GAMM|nr:IS21 family transposase, ORF1 [Endozoicomonas montiporae CL-33]
MINREDYLMIKQARDKGCYLEDIACQRGCSVSTVKRALQRQGPPPRRKSGVRQSKLDDFKSVIDALLAENVWNAEVIFAEIKGQGYAGGITILRDYIHPKRTLRESKATTRYETAPGHQLQHDWGELQIEVGGELRKVYVSVNVLGYSRRFYAFAAYSNDAEHTYESLIRAFEWFGGSSAQVLVDNQKAAVLEHPGNGQVKFNEGFLLLSRHYEFQPKACKPYRAQTKGKTERMVRYVKENFFQRYRSFESLEHLNQQLGDWLTNVADERHHDTLKEKVADALLKNSRTFKSYRIFVMTPATGKHDVCRLMVTLILRRIATVFPVLWLVSKSVSAWDLTGSYGFMARTIPSLPAICWLTQRTAGYSTPPTTVPCMTRSRLKPVTSAIMRRWCDGTVNDTGQSP